MRSMRGAVVAVAAMAAISLVSPGGVQAAPSDVAAGKPMTFPYMYSKVVAAPTFDAQGKPSPWNTVVWDHATVLTRSQTRAVRDSGALPIVANTNVSPYAKLSRAASFVLKGDEKLVRAGGCLALYWSDRTFVGPSGKRVQTSAQILYRVHCRP